MRRYLRLARAKQKGLVEDFFDTGGGKEFASLSVMNKAISDLERLEAGEELLKAMS